MITKQYPTSWFQTVHLFCINKLTFEKKFLKTIYFILGSKVVRSEIIPKSGYSRSSEITLKTLKATLLFLRGDVAHYHSCRCFTCSHIYIFPVPFSKAGETLASIPS